jgi:hypothetical protein
LGDLGIDGIRLIFNKYDVLESFGSRLGSVSGSCEHGKELSASIKEGGGGYYLIS